MWSHPSLHINKLVFQQLHNILKKKPKFINIKLCQSNTWRSWTGPKSWWQHLLLVVIIRNYKPSDPTTNRLPFGHYTEKQICHVDRKVWCIIFSTYQSNKLFLLKFSYILTEKCGDASLITSVVSNKVVSSLCSYFSVW